MKRNFKFASLALGAMMAGVLGSCTAENGYLSEPTTQPANAVNLFKATEINAFSNGISFDQVARTYEAYMNANMYDQDWDCVPNVDLTAEQLEELKELFRKGVETHNTIVLPFENYWVQQVYKGKEPDEAYTPTDINGNPVNGTTITGSNQMDKLVAYNENYTEKEYGGYLDENNQWHQVVTENHYEHVNNFNNGNNTNYPGQCGCGIVHEGTTLMINMDADNVDPEEQFGFHESFGTSHNYNNYIIIEYPEGSGDWYVGFDYEMHKNEAQNANEAKDVERDWNFTDWIVKITPAYHKGETPEEPWRPEETTQPETPTTPDTPSDDCPKCHHPKHEGNCPDCEEGEICNPTPDHVEVNFEVEKHNDYLATHLSIHVRAATDVEVFIPVARTYYVEADDMAIVEQHLENSMSYGGFLTENKVERYVLGEYEITLTMTYEDDGIRVKTEGINEDVLAALNKVTGDGITFEIWNYYNDQAFKKEGEESIELETARERLKEMLDLSHATVEFLDEEPSLYVNAFFFDDVFGPNGEWSGYNTDAQNPWDCFVDIVSKQSVDYGDATVGMFFNKSPFNKKYYKN